MSAKFVAYHPKQPYANKTHLIALIISEMTYNDLQDLASALEYNHAKGPPEYVAAWMQMLHSWALSRIEGENEQP